VPVHPPPQQDSENIGRGEVPVVDSVVEPTKDPDLDQLPDGKHSVIP